MAKLTNNYSEFEDDHRSNDRDIVVFTDGKGKILDEFRDFRFKLKTMVGDRHPNKNDFLLKSIRTYPNGIIYLYEKLSK